MSDIGTVPSSNLNSFLITTTPTGCHAILNTSSLWSAFEEPSFFGVYFPVVDSAESAPRHVVYTPHLSALCTSQVVYQSDEAPITRLPLYLAVQHPHFDLNISSDSPRTSWFSVLWLPASGDPDVMVEAFLAYYYFNPLELICVLPSKSSTWFPDFRQSSTYIQDQINKASILLSSVFSSRLGIHSDFNSYLATNGLSSTSLSSSPSK